MTDVSSWTEHPKRQHGQYGTSNEAEEQAGNTPQYESGDTTHHHPNTKHRFIGFVCITTGKYLEQLYQHHSQQGIESTKNHA